MLSAKPRNPWLIGTTPEFVGGYAQGATSTTISLTSLTGGLASAPAENDIVIVAFSQSSLDYLSPSNDVVGYTEVTTIKGTDSSFASTLAVFWKKMTATPDTSITLTLAGGIDSGSVSIQVWRGQDLSTPFPVTATTATGNNTGVVNPPLINLSTSGSQIIVAGAGAYAFGGVPVMTANDLSNFFTTAHGGAIYAVVGMGSIVSTGGIYDPAAWTYSNDSTSSAWASVTMALKGA